MISNFIGHNHARALLVFLVIGGGGILGCSGDTNDVAPVRTATQLYWALQLNQYVLNLSLTHGDSTFQLSGFAIDAEGNAIPGGDSAVHYSSTDSSITVSPMGLVVARSITSPIPASVVARFTTQGTTLTDTVLVQVTATPITPLRTFSMQPIQGDSAKRSLDYMEGEHSDPVLQGLAPTVVWAVTAVNTAGDTVCNDTSCPLLVHYVSSNPQVATIDPATGALLGNDTGRVTFTATTWAYGVAWRDSVVFTVGGTLEANVLIGFHNTPGGRRVGFDGYVGSYTRFAGVNAVVLFQNDTSTEIGLSFDPVGPVDTGTTRDHGVNFTANGSGDIPPFGGVLDSADVFGGCGSLCNWQAYADYMPRRFTKAGNYKIYASNYPSDTITLVVR